MRRSIYYCEPNHAIAGEINTLKFIYTPSAALPKGTRLKFDLLSKGREIDWQTPEVNLKKNDGLIYAILPDHKNKILQAKEIEVPDSFVPQYEFILPVEVEAGSSVIIILGAKQGETKKKNSGIRAQTTSQRRRSFNLYVDTSGKGHYDEPDVFSLDVRGSILSNIRILTPSFVSKNKRFDVVLRFEDTFGNLTSEAPEDSLIELSYEHIRENLNWKLFIPETGFLSLPNLYFNETGNYTILLRNLKTKQVFQSFPIKCFADNDTNLFWGLLHGESERYDSTENIETCLRHMRDEKAYNFFATSSFESQDETSNDVWKTISQNMTEFNEEDRFTTLLGFQWVGVPKEEGVRHFIYAKDNKPILRKKDPKNNTLKKIYKSFAPKEILSIPCFTMAKGYEYDFKNFSPDFERVVEIYSAWGSSETTKKEGNLYPIDSSDGSGPKETAEGSIQKALMNNCRFGFVAGGLDDRGIYCELFEGTQTQYAPGLTAIISKAQNREALVEALYQRSCYATTGARIIVGFFLAGIPMGKETNTADKPGLTVNRHLSGYVAGTTKLHKVEIIRNGQVVKTFKPDDYSLDFTFDDLTPLDKVVIHPKDKASPFVYYYLRVVQEDGQIAWSSPIWVDLLPTAAAKGTAAKRLPAKSQKVIEEFDEVDEEDEEEDDYTYDDTEDEEE